MGDRANCVVRQQPADVWLYTHWGGMELAETVHKALSKRWSWTDEAYLTRIIFDVMTEGHHGGESGFGITTGLCDNEHNLVVVDCANQQVEIHRAGFSVAELGDVIAHWSFDEFVETPVAEVTKAYLGEA